MNDMPNHPSAPLNPTLNTATKAGEGFTVYFSELSKKKGK
jgi:hypothetical protein